MVAQKGDAVKLVVLESYVLTQDDLDWAAVQSLVPEMRCYPRTAAEDMVARIGDAELVIINKCRITEELLRACPGIKWIGILATGTDNIDLAACKAHGVVVDNVPGYSTYSVAQLTFSLLLAICQCAEREHRAVQDGYWQLNVPAQYALLPQVELFGKTFGVFGYGNIGRQTARIAKAFGMRVLVCTRTIREEYAADGVEFVDFDALLAQSDVLSLHCPATPQTKGMMHADTLVKMKRGAVLLNTARGALIDEASVAEACKAGQLRFYATDALIEEPANPQNPLLGVENIIITPHIAWTTAEALARLVVITTENLKRFLQANE